MITASGPVLVDWDTVQLAPPARDLWMMDRSTATRAAPASTSPLNSWSFYRLRWDLKDLCDSASWFVERHQRTPDTQLVLQGSSQSADG
jgi:spectinomycin phosphotransferase